MTRQSATPDERAPGAAGEPSRSIAPSVGFTLAELRERQSVLGGTDAAAILGVSKYRGPWDVFIDKTSELTTEPLLPDQMGEDALWGLLLEPLIIQEYQRRSGETVRRHRRLLRHPSRRWQGGHVDGLGADLVLEIKTRRSDAGWGEPGTAEVPPDVRVQVEHYLAVTGKSRGVVVVLFRGAKLSIYEIPADPAALADLSDEEGEWWRRHVVLGVEPDLDGSPGATGYLRRSYPRANGETLVAMPHQYAFLDEFAKVRARRAFYDQREETMKQTLMATMGEASKLLSPSMTVHWLRPGPTEVVDWPRYAESLEAFIQTLDPDPEEVGKMDTLKGLYTTERPGRPQLRVYEQKENQLT